MVRSALQGGLHGAAEDTDSCLKGQLTAGLDSDLPSLDDVVERIGFGPSQLRALILGGGVWLADGAVILLVGSVISTISVEWELSHSARGSIVALVFIGVLVGNCLSGWLGDSAGRWLPIVVSYFAVAFFSVCSSMSTGIVTLCTASVFVGCAFGIGQPAWMSLSSELAPPRWRMTMNGSSAILFVVGELYATFLLWCNDPLMRELNWRRLLAMGAIPSIIIGCLAAAFLFESPFFLALNGRHFRAKRTLEDMRRLNGIDDQVSVEFRSPFHGGSQEVERTASGRDVRRACSIPPWSKQLSIVFGRQLIVPTLACCFSCFVLNFTIYGGLYALPQVLPGVKMGISPATALAIGALWEIPGIILGMCLGTVMARKSAIALYLGASFVSLTVFAYAGAYPLRTRTIELLMQAGFAGIKCFGTLGFVVVYQYSTEIFPTTARATGTAACVAFGRLGAMSCPFVFESLQKLTGDFSSFFYTTAALCAMNGIVLAVLPETKGAPLPDMVLNVGGAAKPLTA